MGARLGFPDWFGHHWDAFLDCLRTVVDRPGTAPGSSLLVVDASDRLYGLARRMTGAGCSVDLDGGRSASASF